MEFIQAINTCLCGPAGKQTLPSSFDEKRTIITQEPTFYSDDPASQFVEAIRTANGSIEELHNRLEAIVSANGWTEHLAESIFHGIQKLVQSGKELGSTMKAATNKTIATAEEFAKEHPYYTTLIAAGTLVALGVLAELALPWVLEALGFEALGPRAGESSDNRSYVASRLMFHHRRKLCCPLDEPDCPFRGSCVEGLDLRISAEAWYDVETLRYL